MTKRALRRILLVEDDPDIQEVTTLLLSDIGSFDVRACTSAAEAFETAQAFGPDLILLDVMMPGLDGQGAFAAFRQMPATAATPVIFMTARVQPREIMEYRQLGSLGVIPKPFDPDTLADTIQGMWDRDQDARLNEARREDLAALRRLYATELPERIRAIEEAAASPGQQRMGQPGRSFSLRDGAPPGRIGGDLRVPGRKRGRNAHRGLRERARIRHLGACRPATAPQARGRPFRRAPGLCAPGRGKPPDFVVPSDSSTRTRVS